MSQTILIIDDEPNLRKTLAIILQKAGYTVTTAGHADEAHKLLQAGAFDLVFCDIRMPDKDGLTLLEEIRENYTEMPIVLLTAHASLDSAIEAVRKGATDYLLKPIDPEDILARVRHILKNAAQPKRRRKIMQEMQNLLAELNNLDGVNDLGEDEPKQTPSRDPARYLQRGNILVDLLARTATVEGKMVSLTPTGFDYLVTLLRHSPEAISYKTLVSESQGYEPSSTIEAKEIARWRIHELRKAIEDDSKTPRYIITVRGVGYRLLTS
jgi:DNA-binding response OmpR family regulator